MSRKTHEEIRRSRLYKIKNDINEELVRSKKFVNTHHYDNTTAVNFIVKKYRTDLKLHLKTVLADIVELNELIGNEHE